MLNPSPVHLKKRKFLMMLPLLVLPFVLFLFYVLGGGMGKVDSESGKESGLNLQLPEAHFNKKKDKDKLGLYEMASQDSAKWQEAIKNDPNRVAAAGPFDSLSFSQSRVYRDLADKTDFEWSGKELEKIDPPPARLGSVSQEKEITDKLSRLKAIVQGRTVDPPAIPQFPNAASVHPVRSFPSGQFKEQNKNNSVDPELSELDRMLDKVMAIQHPEMTKDSIHHASDNRPTVYPVETGGSEHAVMAVIPEKQTLVSGATVRLQLNETVTIAGKTLAADQWIYGTAMLASERLHIQIRSIRTDHDILPVSLEVYDLDGMEGIYIPGSIGRDVSKQSLDQSLSGLNVETLDPSIGAQAASAGIQAARALISRKVKQVQVTIPNDYQVYLINTH